jgi:phosphomevalonate kinase
VSSNRATLKGSPLVLAPGKLFLAGEYAVLEGGVALVAAVGRYAVAQFLPGAAPESPLVREAVARAREALGEVADAVPDGTALVDTAGFSEGGVKLGLGSSAAAAVAAAGAVLEYAGVNLSSNKELLFSVADAGHRAAQGGVGSGADIAAAVYGGFVRFVRMPGGAPIISRVLPPTGLHLVPFWTLGAARTIDFIAGVQALRKRDARSYVRHLGALRAGADHFAEAFATGDPRGVIREADAYGQAMEALGKDAGLAIVTPNLRQAAVLARSLGGSAKPSGAGGGDAGLAFFAEKAAADEFAARCSDRVLVLDIGLGATGAYRRLPSGIESFNKD